MFPSEKIAVALYQAASRVHWPARERALRQAFGALGLHGGRRIVDIGCGPGLLARTATELGFPYVGIDPDRAAIDHARRTHPSPTVEFSVAKASDVADYVRPGDIAVLNGVCHHLPDGEFSFVLDALKVCHGIFILDHQFDRETSTLNRILQKNDKGDFVRPSTVFDDLPGYRASYRVVFPIPSAGLPAWRYFCHFYVPVKADA